MREWMVALEVLTPDFALVNRWDPPRFACRRFGIRDVEGNQYLTATIKLSAPDAGAAEAAGEAVLSEYVSGHDVVAQRVRSSAEPRMQSNSRPLPMRWQRAEVDGPMVDVVWDSSEPLERVDIVETATAVSITLYERRYPRVEYIGACSRCVRLRLAAELGERVLTDGSTGRVPGDLTIWEFDERERRQHALALNLDELECIVPAPELVHRA